MSKAIRSLKKLHPRTMEKVKLAMAEIKKKHWDSVFITETRRSAERQKHLRSTWASRVKRSKHQDWLAVDIAFRDDKRTKYVEKKLYPWDYRKWRAIANVFKKYWMDWWYDLWRWDKPHFQDNWKPLVAKSALMLFYEKLWNDNYSSIPKNERIFKDPESFIDKTKNLPKEQKDKELAYLMAILFEKLWQEKANKDDCKGCSK